VHTTVWLWTDMYCAITLPRFRKKENWGNASQGYTHTKNLIVPKTVYKCLVRDRHVQNHGSHLNKQS